MTCGWRRGDGSTPCVREAGHDGAHVVAQLTRHAIRLYEAELVATAFGEASTLRPILRVDYDGDPTPEHARACWRLFASQPA